MTKHRQESRSFPVPQSLSLLNRVEAKSIHHAGQEKSALNEDRRLTQLASFRRATRRFFLRSTLGTLVGGMGLLGWTLLVEPRWLTVTHHDLVLPDLPETWQGRRLVHVSDLHVGRVALGYLKHSMRKINLLQPDVIRGEVAVRGVSRRRVVIHDGGHRSDFGFRPQLLNPDYS